MPGNRGRTSLKTKRRAENPMQEFDRLPAELRSWLSSAALPWRARSVRVAFDRALSRTGNPVSALRELDGLQARLIARDAKKVWGEDYPLVES